jgi:UDP-glucose 4-epimerase
MNVVVTGGAGFIGSNLVDSLIDRGHSVRVVDDLSTGSRSHLNGAAETFIGDVADERLMREVADGAEVVYHQAALRAVQRSVERPLATDRANTHGTLTVLKAALDSGVRRVVYASSSSVYGGSDQLPTPEDAPTWPRSPYAVSKLAGEHYCRVFRDLYGLETVSLRYFNVYGPRQRPESQYAAVIPLFINALRSGQAPIIHGDGRQSRDFTYIDDAVRANLAAASARAAVGKAYNIAGGGAHTLLELLHILVGFIGRELPPVYTDARPGDVRHTLAGVDAARRDLKHRPLVGFEEGLRRTVGWFETESGTPAGSAARSDEGGIEESAG